ncbi:MAG: DMT family transporter [Candidatus Lambdaproteobacteria bacterium]|nr:DMT family transporter [Candidatus Lambdaproteobacteria bacterium]
MIYLLLSILASVCNAMILKRGEMAGHDRLVVMGINYLVAASLATAVWVGTGHLWPDAVTLVLGVVGGFFFAIALFLWMGAIQAVGLATSTAALRLSVVLPIAVSIAFFGERPSLLQALGILLALTAVLLITLAGRARQIGSAGGAAVWLVAVFIGGGGSHVTLKLFTEWGPPEQREALLALIFISAGLMTWAVLLAGRRRLARRDVMNGSLFGVLNVTGNSFLLLGLHVVPGVLAFPLNNTGMLFLSGLLGVVVWRERPGRPGYLAIATAGAAIVLLAL